MLSLDYVFYTTRVQGLQPVYSAEVLATIHDIKTQTIHIQNVNLYKFHQKSCWGKMKYVMKYMRVV